MSNIKWIKLSTEIFDDEKIKLIDALPENDAIFVIWIKLLILAGKINENGAIYLNEEIPYTDEMLSTIFHKPLNTVRLALKTFQQFKMIEMKQTAIHIVNWGKHQNIEGLDRIREKGRLRQQKYRQKQIENKAVTLPNVMVTEQTRIENRIDKIKEDKKVEDRLKPYFPLSELLYYEHKKVDSKYLRGKDVSDVLKNWANDIRLLVEKDGRTIEEIEQVIKWVKTEGNFWFVNIMSGKKLRLQFPKLLLQMKQEGKKPGSFKGTDEELHSYDEFFGGSK